MLQHLVNARQKLKNWNDVLQCEEVSDCFIKAALKNTKFQTEEVMMENSLKWVCRKLNECKTGELIFFEDDPHKSYYIVIKSEFDSERSEPDADHSVVLIKLKEKNIEFASFSQSDNFLSKKVFSIGDNFNFEIDFSKSHYYEVSDNSSISYLTFSKGYEKNFMYMDLFEFEQDLLRFNIAYKTVKGRKFFHKSGPLLLGVGIYPRWSIKVGEETVFIFDASEKISKEE